MSDKIVLETNGIKVEGKIIKREKFFIEVEITQPYDHYRDYLMISGLCRRTPHHFLTDRGEAVALDILKNIYKKLEMIDKSIDRLVRVYADYLEEMSQIHHIPKKEVRDRMRSKLEDWLFKTIFVSSVTGMIAAINERPQLFKILEAYRRDRVKLYKRSGGLEKHSINGWRIIFS